MAETEELLSYFHAHDQHNYGRWGPLYAAEMLEFWKYVEERNFAISKLSAKFIATDPDHATEYERKEMKSKGEFDGITGNCSRVQKVCWN